MGEIHQSKLIEWLNEQKNKIQGYTAYKRLTSSMYTWNESEGMEKVFSSKWWPE